MIRRLIRGSLGFLRKLRLRARMHVFHIPLDMYVSGLLRRGHLGMRREYGHIHYFDRFTAIETLKYTNYKIIDARYTHIAEDLLDVHPERKNLRRMIGNAGRRCLRSLLNEDWSNQNLGRIIAFGARGSELNIRFHRSTQDHRADLDRQICIRAGSKLPRRVEDVPSQKTISTCSQRSPLAPGVPAPQAGRVEGCTIDRPPRRPRCGDRSR